MTPDKLVILWPSTLTIMVRGPKSANPCIKPHAARYDRRANAWRVPSGHLPALEADLERAGFQVLTVGATGGAA